MSEQGTTKDQVSLDDLKRAIDAVEVAWKDDAVSDYAAAALRAEAWRTAFEWLNQNGVEVFNYGRCVEYDEGMRLIREKLP